MCATCVAQGAVYVGGALTGLQVMAARARNRRAPASPGEPPRAEPVGAGADADRAEGAAPADPEGAGAR